MTVAPPLRVALLVDQGVPRQWQAEAIERIADEPGIEARLVVLDGATGEPTPLPRADRIYRRLDAELHAEHQAPFRRRRPGRALRLWRPGVDQEPPFADGAPEVLVQLGENRPRGPWAEAARYGLWTIDDQVWAPVAGPRRMGSAAITVHRRGAVAGVVGTSRCGAHEYSLARSRATLFSTVPALLLRALRQLRDLGEEALTDLPSPTPERPPPVAAAGLIRYGLRLGRKVADWSLFDTYHWVVAVGPRPSGIPTAASLGAPSLQLVADPADRFLADPFLFEHEGRVWLFVEEYAYARGRGVIAAAPLDGAGRPGPWSKVLERDYHLSYPFVFRHDGRIWMIPETSAQGTVELYVCERFPDQWRRERVLLDGINACDATLLPHEGRLWLFAGVAAAPFGEVELHLFHASTLDGSWRPHRRNPVVADAARARPGGRIWREGDALIRPAQDGSLRYGQGLTFQRLRTLTVDEYEEEPIGAVEAAGFSWIAGAVGTHTYDAVGDLCATDACVVRFRGRRWLDRARRTLSPWSNRERAP